MGVRSEPVIDSKPVYSHPLLYKMIFPTVRVTQDLAKLATNFCIDNWFGYFHAWVRFCP